MSSNLLLYDADCSICTKFKKTIDFLDAKRKINFMSIDQAELAGLLDAVPDRQRHSSFHLILPDGRLESGAEALPSLIRLLPAGRISSKLIVSAPGGRTLLSFLYSTLSRLHEVGSCKMQTSAVTTTRVEHYFRENSIGKFLPALQLNA